MSEQSLEPPFGLTNEQIAQVEIFYGYYSAKTGAGKQEIEIKGDGVVTLVRTRAYDSEPETREGQLPHAAVIRLLDYIEAEDFFALDDVYPTDTPVARRVLRVTLPGKTKTVAVDEAEPFEFERVLGAVKFAAGLALPEALKQRFFANP